MMIFIFALVTLASLAVSAFCSGSEMGFLSIHRGRLTHLVRAGSKRAKVLQTACQNLSRTTAAILVGNNLANVTYSSATAALSSLLFAQEPMAQSIWSVGAAFALLFFGEFAPKLLCAARPLRRMLNLAPFWKVFTFVFVPIGALVMQVIGRFIPKRETTVRVTPDMVLKILADRKDGVKLSNLENALIGRILSLRAHGKSVTPDSLLSVLDEAVLG